jgi:catechol 2,3-dioxygenase-like lactoylglutathione lyase family enzyme
MSRLQLALNVADLDTAVDFYTKLFSTAPHKRRDGYANFAIEDPPLKLVLFEGGEPGTTSLNHLGVEVFGTDEVVAAGERFAAAGLQTRDSIAELCCHAVQDKVYAQDPNGREWEYYTILDDEPESAPGEVACGVDASGAPMAVDACGVPAAVGAPMSLGAELPQAGADAGGCC